MKLSDSDKSLISEIQEKIRKLSLLAETFSEVADASAYISLRNICENVPTIKISDDCIPLMAIPASDTSDTIIIEPGYTLIGKVFRENTTIKRIVLPETVDYIEEGAFLGCTNLEEITLPKSMVQIGARVFQNCESLKRIVWPEGVTELPELAFYGCTNLETVVIPEGITSIARSAFEGCIHLQTVTLPDSLKRIAEEAFEGCTSLAEIVFPSELSYIGPFAFYECKSLQSIALPDGIREVYDRTFMGCAQMKSLHLPKSLSWLGRKAFCNCTSLISVIIPESVKIILESTFENCESLCDVVLPDTVKRIDSRAFKKCLSLDNVVLPKSLERLGDEVFSECISLKRITIPEKCYSIRANAFQGCCDLTEVNLHDHVFYIGPSAFAGCKKLRSLSLPRKLSNLDISSVDDLSILADEYGFVIAGKTLYYYLGKDEHVCIPESIEVIYKDVFAFCPDIKHVKLPPRLRNTHFWQDGSLFADENGFLIINQELYGYYGNEENVVVPNGVKLIHWNVFTKNKAVKRVKLPESIEWLSSDMPDFKYFPDDNGFVVVGGSLFGYLGTEEIVSVPGGVISIERNAFSQAPQVSQVLLPEGIKYIFVGSDENEWRKFADANGFVISGTHLFKCYNVRGSVVLPDYITQIDSDAFIGNPDLEEVWVPATMRPFVVNNFDVRRIKWKAQ